MKNLINFFFSFDKLMKEKLILPFFWLAVIAWGLQFFEAVLSAISLGLIAFIVGCFKDLVTILFALVLIRLLCELAVAVFRINDNLSPDGGKSETADIDPMVEARKIAEATAERAREVAKTAGEKTQAATKSARDSISGMSNQASDSVKPSKGNDNNPAKAAPKKPVAAKAVPSRRTAPKNPATKTSAPKKTPAKPKSTSSKASTSTTAKKRGPKAGVKVRRDAQGRLLKKDGTLRAKPGPKK